jgi:hypothetical protein
MKSLQSFHVPITSQALNPIMFPVLNFLGLGSLVVMMGCAVLFPFPLGGWFFVLHMPLKPFGFGRRFLFLSK